MTANDDAIALLEQVEAKLREVSKVTLGPLFQAQKALDQIIEREGKRPTDKSTGIECTEARCLEVLNAQTTIITPLL